MADRHVEQQGLQGNILCGYGNDFRFALYGFFHVEDAAAGRELLGQLLEDGEGITNAVPWPREERPLRPRSKRRVFKPRETRNVALTYAGMQVLEVDEEALEPFPLDFKLGMAAKAIFLGDTGPSHPDEWEEGLKPGRPHVLVIVHAQAREDRDRRIAWLRQLEAATPGLKLIHHVEAELIGDPGDPRSFGREHFGFADGVSQPSIADPRAGPNRRRGKGTPRRMGWNDVAPGEFVLGYQDEDGLIAGEGLPRRLARNGSFMVVRKLQQNVALFNRFVAEAADREDLPEELVAAKLVGRWRSGAPLVLAPEQDDLDLTASGKKARRINAFRYGRSDTDGLKCPIGSHVRRANPRDALGWQGKLTKRHRIIRRGMPYGEPFDRQRPDDGPRGLMFVCYQASIERQFEVIQGHWMNDGDVFGLGSDRDFLAAEGGDREKAAIPWSDRPPSFLSPLPRIITTRGGDYFFAPGLFALQRLADGDPVS